MAMPPPDVTPLYHAIGAAPMAVVGLTG